jgi:hypothetical protein
VALDWKCDETCEHFANETKKVVGSPKSKVDFDSASKDEGSKEMMEKPLTLDEVKK